MCSLCCSAWVLHAATTAVGLGWCCCCHSYVQFALAVDHPHRTLVIAAVSVVFPWSTCPIVPTFKWGLVRVLIS